MPDHVPDDVRRANFLVGKATHSIILEGRKAFSKKYTLEGSRVGKRRVLTQEQFEMVECMNDAVSNNFTVRELLGSRVAEGVVRAAYCGFSCQVRFDWFNPMEGIVDLKTTRDSNSFDYDAEAYRYYNQFAFYRSVLKAAFGVIVPVTILVVGKENPFCEVHQIASDYLDFKAEENEKVLDRMRSIQMPGTWSGPV